MFESKTSCALRAKEYTWHEIRDEVKAVNVRLFDIIEQISPNKKLTLYKFSYPYGTKIIDNGQLNVPPENGQALKISDTSVPKTLQNGLRYRSIPLALVLNKALFPNPPSFIVR